MKQESYKVERSAWINMLHRCYNERNTSYANYGARGIGVCERWRDPVEGFNNFFADMGRRPAADMSLDRLDVNGHYGPENCQWSTKSQQQQNRRPYDRSPPAKLVTINGVSKSQCEWARLHGLSHATIRKRIESGRVGEEIIHKGRLPRRCKGKLPCKSIYALVASKEGDSAK